MFGAPTESGEEAKAKPMQPQKFVTIFTIVQKRGDFA
jgi:hypothetical protein